MTLSRPSAVTICATILLLALTPATPAQEPPEPGVHILARGPVHEAYAKPLEMNPRPGPVAPRQPPPPIPEIPPDQKPPGDNVQWVGGYWAWDEERNDFLWVSGVYRVVPPGRKWVTGYWAEAPDGWRWVAGFWAPAGPERVPHVAVPPASLEAGPSVPAPDESYLYTPGCWTYRAEKYWWQPGYWYAGHPGWVWCPPHYCWTPAGCAFVEGFWDHPLDRRGLLFAPVGFDRPLWKAPDWRHRPGHVLGLDGLLAALFVRRACGHYYFGDYFGATYAGLGFQPWYSNGVRSFDPLLTYGRWNHRADPSWYAGLGESHRAFADGTGARLPRTLEEQTRLLQRSAPPRGVRVLTPLGQFRGDVPLIALSAAQRAEQQALADRPRETGQRSQLERSLAGGAAGVGVRVTASAFSGSTSGYQPGPPPPLPRTPVAAVSGLPRAPAGAVSPALPGTGARSVTFGGTSFSPGGSSNNSKQRK
jgi:hypothetical protein